MASVKKFSDLELNLNFVWYSIGQTNQLERKTKMKYQYINTDKLIDKELELLNLLDERPEVKFIFGKKDDAGSGEVRREDRSTRNTEYIPREKWPKNPTDDVGKKIDYYDFDRNDWRGVSVGKLIEIKEG